MQALLNTGPNEDLDRVNQPWVEKVFDEMFGSPARRR